MWNGAMDTALNDAYNNVVKNNADPTTEIQKAYDTCKAELDRQLAG